jgi:hypothetical protein
MAGYKRCDSTRSAVMLKMPSILEWRRQGQKTKEILQRLRAEDVPIGNAQTLNAYIHEHKLRCKIKYIMSETTEGFSDANQ